MKAIFKSPRVGLFLDAMKIGCLGFGGGTALIPVMQEILVEKKRLISQEAFEKDILIASVTPGALPVEIAGGAGARIGGWSGMLLGAAGMALPGVLMTLLSLSALSMATETLMGRIEKLSLGVMAFVLCLLTDYIVKTYQKEKNKKATCATILAVFLLTGGKNLLKLFGVSPAFFPSLMTIHVFVMMFFLTFYVHGEHSAPKIVTATVLCALYVAGLTAPDTDAWRFLTMGAASLMGLLSVYGVASHQELGKLPVDREGYRNVSREVFSEMVFAAALSVPALALSRNAFLFLANGALSSFMSFGGGDAYLTVADGLFVGAGLLDSDTFYGRIAPVVNLFPGSILCKTLSAVGYSVGMAETDSVAVAFSLAIGGFACSVSGSCLSFSAMKYIYQRFGTLPVFALIRNGVRPVVSGLMLSVIVTMLRQGGKVETDAFFLNGVSLLLAEWALGCFLKFRRKWNGAKIIACLTLCNAPIL